MRRNMTAPGFPHLRLDRDALDHNITVMAEWCGSRDVLLAPHVKTTMSAPIVRRQSEAGSSGVTVATVDQAGILLGWGQRIILIANQVVDHHGLSRVRDWLTADPTLQIRIFVDSVEGVTAAGSVFGGSAVALEVLLDVGAPGGRTGLRSLSAARTLAALVGSTPGLSLVGVAGYEGVVANSRAAAVLSAVDAHCRMVRDVYLAVADLFDTPSPVFSMGGSAFPDRVIEFLPADSDVPGTVRLLRSGCYVTHDHGTYAGVSPIPGLVPALTVRAVVLSAPEDGMAVVGAGKRELPYDAGLPSLIAARTADGAAKPAVGGRLERLFDHHAVLTGVTGLKVTDVVEFGLSHPCSAFDRWPEYIVTDATGKTEVWRTDFHRDSISQSTNG
jgi:D-serine deaminase-like pyridoxal phosphate-dependent protein